MTTEQKLKIIELRNSGLTPKMISEKLGIGESYVKKIMYDVSTNETICLNCGRVIPKGNRRPKKFCSDKCRFFYHNSHQEDLHKKTIRI